MRYIVLYSLIISLGFCASLQGQKPTISLIPLHYHLEHDILNDTSSSPDSLFIVPVPIPAKKEKAKKECIKPSPVDSISREPQGQNKSRFRLSVIHPLKIRKQIIGFIFITALNI